MMFNYQEKKFFLLSAMGANVPVIRKNTVEHKS